MKDTVEFKTVPHMFSGDMDAESGLLREDTTTNGVSGLLSGDTTMDREDEILQRSHSVMRLACSGVCKIICVMIALVCAFVGGATFQKYANRTETEHAASRLTGQATEEMGFTHRISDYTVSEMRLFPNGECAGNSCIKCTAIIPARKVLRSMTCENDNRVRNASCFLYEDRCYTLQDLKKRVVRVHMNSKCCTYAQMTPCDNGGYSVCFSDKGDPVCQCQNGWRGETCQEKLTVQCKCYRGGYRFCGEEGMEHCDNIQYNTNWPECHLYADRPDEKLNCICNRSIDSVNGEDGETEPCSSTQANTLNESEILEN